jgi:hypothetical protein
MCIMMTDHVHVSESINCRGYSYGRDHHKRFDNMLKSLLCTFISLDLKFVISSLLLYFYRK